MGGVHTNLDGETNIQGLFAAGEVACTGVHGANRLASNSLLEGLVFGARSAKKALEYYNVNAPDNSDLQLSPKLNSREAISVDSEKIRRTLRQLMWGRDGIIRCAESLGVAKKWLDKKRFIMDMPALSRRECELKNMVTVARLITDSALLREGSVGAHYRSDFKERGDNWQNHTICQQGRDAGWVDATYGALR
jgi:L-aspartate oxidase